MIDDSDDGQGEGEPSNTSSKNEYEDHEPEQDPDCPYSDIIYDSDLELESAVIHLAIPVPPASQRSGATNTQAPIVIACADGAIKLLHIPLAPPADDDNDPSNSISQTDLPSLHQPARAIAAKIVPAEEEDSAQSRPKNQRLGPEPHLLVASASSSLNVCSVNLDSTTKKKRRVQSICTMSLSSPATAVAFHPSSTSTQLLVSDLAGVARLFDPFPSGTWRMAFPAPHQTQAAPNNQPTRRKRILSSVWVLGGRGILVLLEDGEWGVWVAAGSNQAEKRAEDFAINGFLGAAAEAAEPAKSKKPSKLAPMTPNTRKAKSDSLFTGSSKTTTGTMTGGLTVASLPTRNGSPDETLVLWYGNDIYSVPSMQQFWQRSTNNSGNFGSLYAPGMTHTSDINLLNERITSIQPIAHATQASSLGQLNTQRDLIVSGEHRMIITETIRPSAPTRQLFQEAAERPVSRDNDQRMLDAGDLDLGGLNRMLDSRVEDARPRKVGFAH